MADAGDAAKRGFWKRMAAKVPGSIKPVPNGERGRGLSFNDFDNELSDAWSEGEDEFFTAGSGGGGSSKRAPAQPPRATAVRATPPSPQQQRKPGSAPPSATGPKAAGQRQDAAPTSAPAVPRAPRSASSSPTKRPAAPAPARAAGGRPPSGPTTPTRPTPSGVPPASTPPTSNAGEVERHAGAQRLERFRKLLTSPNLDLAALRELSWSGIPAPIRPTTWRLLSGYLPANIERRDKTLSRKRAEYAGFIERYYGTRHDGTNEATFHQIHIDVPRTSPAVPTFQQPTVQEMFERILFIWAIRHPGSGYVQGINDLVTPFFAVFLMEHVDVPLNDIDVSLIPEDVRASVEADAFWCMTKLLDGIQDNYTFAQPGIQKKVMALKDLIGRVDAELHEHLEANLVEYLQFAFRWMNCLLMREIPLEPIIRLWDTYHAEPGGFATFHLYVCAAFLITFSKELKALGDFQQLLQFLQNLPTKGWDDKNIKLLLAEAYHLKYVFHDAQTHLK